MSASKTFVVTTTTKPLYDEWFSRALADDTVWPFLTFDKRTCKAIIDDDDWDRIVLMDRTKTAVLSWVNDRASGMNEASVSLWSLNTPAKKNAAGRLAMMIPVLAKRYGVRFINSACHASNAESASILDRRYGACWGIKRESAWNGLLGRFEDSMHFRKLV